MVYANGIYVKRFSMKLSDAVKSLRAQRGWTQARLAEELQKRVNAIARWEQGVRTPPPDTCRRLMQLANKESEEFYALREATVPAHDGENAASEPTTNVKRLSFSAVPATEEQTRSALHAFLDMILDTAPVEYQGKVAEVLENGAAKFAAVSIADIPSAEPKKRAPQPSRRSERLHDKLERLLQSRNPLIIEEAEKHLDALAKQWVLREKTPKPDTPSRARSSAKREID
jgi:transcriptional regulator with XRE-family HTH domain